MEVTNLQPTIRINHMYSKSLNVYGDIGNIYALKYRAERRNIALEVVNTEIGDQFIEADIYLIGGGQDKDQSFVYKDLLKHADIIKAEIEKGKVFLLICGGYQLFGNFFVDGEGNILEGLGILDIETKALDTHLASRCIGNIVVQLAPNFISHWNIDTSFSEFIVGFENHGGQTVLLSTKVQPLGITVMGYGNNSYEKQEGGWYNNCIGTYCHGSFLPKNPHITDAIIARILKNQKRILNLSPISSSAEQEAHDYILKLYSSI